MQALNSTRANLDKLVALVEQDIQDRGLRHGDRYLTTQEVAGLLGVSTRFANDALKVLAERNVLQRRPKAGTTIGPEAATAVTTCLDIVHLLIRQSYFVSERSRMDQFVTGLTRELPGTSLQFTFIPAFNELAAVERLVKSMHDAKMRAGYMIAVKSPQVQDFFQQGSVPVVLLGMPYAGVTRLPWMDKDQRTIGRSVTREVIARGHGKIGVVLRDRRGYGDDVMMDAVMQEVLEVRLGAGALIVRSVPTEPELTENTVRSLLSNANRPTALICRSRMIFEAAVRVMKDLKLKSPKDVQLALCDPASESSDGLAVNCIRPRVQVTGVDEGAIAARMLAAMARGEQPDPDHHLIPVELP